jgi:hypothetical protein
VVVGGEFGELDLGVGIDAVGRLDLHGCEMLRGAVSVERQAYRRRRGAGTQPVGLGWYETGRWPERQRPLGLVVEKG